MFLEVLYFLISTNVPAALIAFLGNIGEGDQVRQGKYKLYDF